MATPRTSLWVIVPMRGLAASKSRLAPVLDAAERVALNRALLERTLAVIGKWCGTTRRCVVVSPCTRVLALARTAGAVAAREGGRPVGLNRAAAVGVAQARARGAERSLILVADLPFLSEAALDALARAAAVHPIVVAPDRTGAGTNALAVETGIDFDFSFGPKSFDAHRAAAEHAGLSPCVVRHRDLQFDLDTPEDLVTAGGGDRPWVMELLKKSADRLPSAGQCGLPSRAHR
jgi:2-phospho-L-lactate guanylyltransferase